MEQAQEVAGETIEPPLLEAVRLSVGFGGVFALDDVSLGFGRGAVTAVIGPNGAGKSTLLAALSGLVAPQEGRVIYDGRDISDLAVHSRAHAGIARTFQNARGFPTLTAVENLLLGWPDQRAEAFWRLVFRRPSLRRQQRRRVAAALGLLERFGLAAQADTPAGELSGGQKKLLELARLSVSGAAIALLDEPAAGVSPAMLPQVIEAVELLKAQGMSIALVEHNMRLVERLADRVHVLAAGRLLVSGAYAEVMADERVLTAYLGRVA